MSNPWMDINLKDYEGHMQLDSVQQLPVLNQMMHGQFYRHAAATIMILGIAGGNGLNHIDPEKICKVYGVDINPNYLAICLERYPSLAGVFEPIQADLSDPEASLPHADLVIANLLVEYIGCNCLQEIIGKVKPVFVSCIIQINDAHGFVSESPYASAFTRLDEVHHQLSEPILIGCMREIGYSLCHSAQEALPNGKKLLQLDFSL